MFFLSSFLSPLFLPRFFGGVPYFGRIQEGKAKGKEGRKNAEKKKEGRSCSVIVHDDIDSNCMLQLT